MLRPNSRVPELAFPFAVVGLAAGWLSAGFLANPVVGVSTRGERGLAAVLAALVGAGIGAALTRLCVRRPDLPMDRPLLFSVIAGGVTTGGIVGGAEAGLARGLPAGLLNGLLSALAFLPVCALVLGAARSAVRARLGSIVAGSDRRAVWGILAAALAAATLLALPDWPAARIARGPLPLAALGMAAGAALVLALILAADGVALARVARLGRLSLEPQQPGELAADDAVPDVDLGLGDEVSAQLSRAASAYRSQPRAVALLLGSAGEARAAIRRAMARTAAGLAVAAAALGAHAWAAGDGGVVAYGALRCEQGSANGCAAAGALLARDLRDGDDEVARFLDPQDLLREACRRGSGEGCAALSRLLERSPSPGDAGEALQAAKTACISGETERCRAVVARIGEREPGEGATFARIGCGHKDAESCRSATALGERAAREMEGRCDR